MRRKHLLKKQICSFALAMTMALTPVSGMNLVHAASKTAVINEVNTVYADETLTYHADVSGTLEVVVPLANAPENGSGWTVTVRNQLTSYQKTYNSYDQMSDVVVLSELIPAGEHTISFTGQAVCKINFTPSGNTQMSSGENYSFDTAQDLPLNVEMKGSSKPIYSNKVYYKVVVPQAGLLQIKGSGWYEDSYYTGYYKIGLYNYNVYKLESNGNLSLCNKEWLHEECSDYYYSNNTVRFYTEPATYYIEINQWSDYNNYSTYSFTASFTPATSQRERESNDTYLTATDIPANQDYVGNLEQDTDIDWYHVQLSSPVMGLAQVTTPRQTKDDRYEVTLYSLQSGKLTELGSAKSKTNNIIHATSKKYLTAGDYYIKVKSGTNSVYNKVTLSEEDYQVKLATEGTQIETPSISSQVTTKKNKKQQITVSLLNTSAKGDGLEVYERVGTGAWSLVTTTDNTTYSKELSQVGTTYSYRVRSVYKDNNGTAYAYSDFSNEVSHTVTDPKNPTQNQGSVTVNPSVPVGNGGVTNPNVPVGNPATSKNKETPQITMSVEKDKATLQLQNPSAKGDELEIYKRKKGGLWTLETFTINTSYVLTLQSNEEYEYRVRAVYKEDGVKTYSEYSNIVSAKMGDTKETVKEIPQIKVSVEGNKATLQLQNPSAKGDGLEIYERKNGSQWKLLTTTTNTSYETTLEQNTEHEYRVRAVYNDGTGKVYSGYSLMVQAKIGAGQQKDEEEEVNSLESPSVTVKRENFNTLTVYLRDIDENADSIYLYEKIGKGKWRLKEVLDVDDEYFNVTMPKISRTYQYKAKAVSEQAGNKIESDFSDVAKFYFSTKLPKPKFKLKKVNYYGYPAVYVEPVEDDYAQGIEIATKGPIYDDKQSISLQTEKGAYVYGTGKHIIKIRSYRWVNNKKIYSPWTATKTIWR